MAQFDIYRNPGPRSASDRPFLVDVQSNRFRRHPFRLVAVLARRAALPVSAIGESHLTPTFTVCGVEVFLNPFELTPVPLARLGPVVASLAGDEEATQRIQKALDAVLSHA